MFERLFVECLDVYMHAGVLFIPTKDISVHPTRWQVLLEDGKTNSYGDNTNLDTHPQRTHSIRRV